MLIQCKASLNSEEVSSQSRFVLAQLPSISPFLREKFMETPAKINPVTSRLLNFEKENTEKAVAIVMETRKTVASKKDMQEIMSKVQKPNTQRHGDWLCLKCNNFNFAFRTECNVCSRSKTEFIQI